MTEPTRAGGPGFWMYRPGAQPPKNGAVEQDCDIDDAILPPDATVDLSTDLAGKNVEDTLARLDAELIGLPTVKARVREIAALLLVDRARQRFGLSADRPTMHMSFTGGPGTGKTTVALRMAEMLHALGYIRKPKVHTVTRDDLVGQFIGHTAPKTKEALAKAAGGVLFIDEAYYLFRPENERDYGQEVIEILLQEMETERARRGAPGGAGGGSLRNHGGSSEASPSGPVVIFAGYADRMDTFFSANPGLSSRVAHHLEFPDYTRDELLAIARVMVADSSFRFTGEADAAFGEYVGLRMARPRFANARSVRNAIDRCRLRQADRLVRRHEPLGRADLMTLTAEDVYGSSVFGDREGGGAPPGGEPPCPTE
ncbi:putative ATPase associated with various cellular activities [Nocardia nova SH22a]|uniref:Putative ATPase associated with various cellular activities n=1 Tax=Nocardia nova SH22a TaxID=1415166 RepID=W5THC5_9NOCA|nr:AAA family ATPase [Nocardia nova]AHH18765.1 putative ATPase associated with various cellular activities [Nocardia nova SH22a]